MKVLKLMGIIMLLIVGVSPSPSEVKQFRMDVGITQTQAAALIYKKCRTWQQYESGGRKMDLAFWELFLIKVEGFKVDV